MGNINMVSPFFFEKLESFSVDQTISNQTQESTKHSLLLLLNTYTRCHEHILIGTGRRAITATNTSWNVHVDMWALV